MATNPQTEADAGLGRIVQSIAFDTIAKGETNDVEADRAFWLANEIIKRAPVNSIELGPALEICAFAYFLSYDGRQRELDFTQSGDNFDEIPF